nr:transmembrane protein [Mycolicibacterium komanii]
MQRQGGHDQRRTAVQRADKQEWATFTLHLPRVPVLVRLKGRDPLVRSVDRVEAMILTLAVAVSLIAVPIAGAVGTALFDSKRATSGAAIEAVTAGSLVLLAVVAAAVTVLLVTRAVCNRIRSARWQRGLDSLVDGREGQSRTQ